MAAQKILLVQNDNRPVIVASLTDEKTGAAVDMTGATVKLYFRAVGATTLKDTLTGQLLLGKREDDGSVNVAAPYNVLGAGGRVQFPFGASTLNTSGQYEGEIEVTFADAGKATVYDKLKFKIRGELGP